jgi:type IV secretion system protein VirB9
MKRLTTVFAIMLTTLGSLAIHAQTASRNVSYHSQDIVPIRAKVPTSLMGSQTAPRRTASPS